jgi:hypothetical protein
MRELCANLVWPYGSLQNTLERKEKEFVDSSIMVSRIRELVSESKPF